MIHKVLLKNHILYLIGRNEEKLKHLSNKSGQLYFSVDATDENQVEQELKKIVKEGRLDGVSYLKLCRMTPSTIHSGQSSLYEPLFPPKTLDPFHGVFS